LRDALEVGGEYAYRIRGEAHMWRPSVVADLQHAVRGELPEKYWSYAKQINEQSEQLLTLRGMFRIKTAEELGAWCYFRRGRACWGRQALRPGAVVRLDQPWAHTTLATP
jgi:glutamate synthase domain-containing protein 2